ncbi:hypothetical protein CsSME_00038783 [Camellia sinensis var. sinensis]
MERGEEAVIDSFKDLPHSLVATRARNLISKLNQQPKDSSDKFGGELDLSADIPWASGAQSSRGQQRGGRSGFSATNRGGRGGRGQGPYPGGPNEISAAVREGTTPTPVEKSWASVVASNQRSSVKLRYFPPSVVENDIVIDLPKRDDIEKCEATLVGHFLGKNMNIAYIRAQASRLWKNKGLKSVLSTANGFVFFMFDIIDSSTAVLEDGPWFIGGHFIVLKKWHSMMKLSKDQLDKIPIWVKLFNVPMEYWDDDDLSRIASAIGELLYMDRLTAHGDRVSFAKVCVEIRVDSILPTDFLIKCEGENIEVGVEYLWKPAKCTKCQVFAHADDRCIRTQVENIVQSSTEQQVQNSDEEWKKVMAKGKRKVGEPSIEVSDVSRQDGDQVDCGVQEVLVAGILSEIEINASIEVTDVTRQHGGQDACNVQDVPIPVSSSEIVKVVSEVPESILDPSEPDPEIQANSLSLEEEVADRVMLTQRMLRSTVKLATPKATGSSSSRRKKKRVCAI